MNDLLWLENHPLQGNIMGIPISWDPDTPEGLESRLSVRIHRIPIELLHSTELLLRKLHRTRMDSSRASVLELLWGLPTSQKVLWPSEPHLSLFSTKIEFGSPLGGGGKPHFLHTFCCGKYCGIYTRSKAVLYHVSFLHRLWALDTISTASSGHVDKAVFGNAPTHGRPATPWLSWAHALCHIISSCHIFSYNALIWT
jgi:hypothetical protein